MIVLVLIPACYAENNETDVVGDVDNDIIYFDASSEIDGDGTADNPYNTLTASRIVDDSTICLANGEYEIDSSKTITSNVIIGCDPENTVIKYSQTLFTVNGNLVLKNLTIKNASISNRNTLTCENVIFMDSSSYTGGALSTLNRGNVHLTNCTFYNNSANYGGAIYAYSSVVYINNCSFFNNSASALGGAVCDLDSTFVVNNSRANNNKALHGGSIYKI